MRSFLTYLTEEPTIANRGLFKAIFITGGPGSGKDVIIREAIASNKITELNFIQARDYLADKQKLSEKSNDYRRESIRTRNSLIINCSADDIIRIEHIKEELEDLGYQTMMIFVSTTNEASKQRNEQLTRKLDESIRHNKWIRSHENVIQFNEMYNNCVVFDNTDDVSSNYQKIKEVYQNTKEFLDSEIINETAQDWLYNRGKLDINHKINSLFTEDKNVKTTNRFLQTKINPSLRTDSPSDIPADNRASEPNADDIKWDGGKKRGSYTFRTYVEENKPTLKISAPPKESNFSKDNDKNKKMKRGDTSGKEVRPIKTDGIGSEWNTRTNGSGLTGGAGLGESQEYSNANPASTAFPSGGSPNPLSSDYDPPRKPFKYFRNKAKKESIDSPGEVSMGVGGVLGGAMNKEPMGSNKDNLIGFEFNKKKKKKGAQ